MLFFFNDTATTEIYTLSLHDALPISAISDFNLGLWADNERVAAAAVRRAIESRADVFVLLGDYVARGGDHAALERSEEHTSELQSRQYLVCRLLLEKKKK